MHSGLYERITYKMAVLEAAVKEVEDGRFCCMGSEL